MWETSARLLRLLSLLQSRPDWTGPELAERLDVTVRTVRRDVDRLRGLGYPVDATPGVAGGYRLGVGATLPPLLLEDDEAVAVAIGLRAAAGGTVAGIEETSVRALAKLEHVLPTRLRHRVHALATTTVALPQPGPTVRAEVLSALAAACRNHERLRFDYADHGGRPSLRITEPHRLVCSARRWYLLAWDLDRADWRTFRVDRLTPRIPTGPRFTPRPLSDADVAARVSRGVGQAMWRVRATVRLFAPAATIAERLPDQVGAVEAVDEQSCLLHTGASTLDSLALHLGAIGTDFAVLDPPELLDHVRALAERYTRASVSATPRCSH